MLVETTIGTTLLLYTAAKRSRPQSEFLVASNGTKCVSMASGKTVGAIMTEEFDELAGVDGVNISRDGNHFFIEVGMSAFDRPTRRRVYDKERELYKRFPKYTLSVHLNDQSQQAATINAYEG